MARAERFFAEACGIELPEGYRSLLGIVNGIGFNGVLFYSTEDGATSKGAARFGLCESNDRLIGGSGGLDTSLRFVGETGNQLFAFDTATGTWPEVDRTAWDLDSPADPHPSFEALFEAQYTTFVDW